MPGRVLGLAAEPPRQETARRPRTVVALGGNAFTQPDRPLTMAGQFEFAQAALQSLLPLLGDDAEVLLSHGNGPQVGHMMVRVERALGEAYELPLEVCVADSAGELGYVLQQSLHNVLAEAGSPRMVASLLTQVVVDADDPAFAAPTKPVGPFYSAERAAKLATDGFVLQKRSGGFRRVVPSPVPLEVIELEVAERLLQMGVVVIAGGGGGIPVVREGLRLRGVDAVIDKDRTAALIAERIGAEVLILLTIVPCAYLRFGTPEQEAIGAISVDEARRLASDGHFPEGSMGPKVAAAADFVAATGRRAIICDPDSLVEALAGRAGTRISSEGGQ